MELLKNCADVLTIEEAAEVLRISPKAIRRLIDVNEMKHIEIDGKPLILKIFLIDFIKNIANLDQICYNKEEK